MTVEGDPMRLIPAAGVRLVFLDKLAPLPLLDPTEAARILNVKRHTLACYRNLGSGPSYYKFGRWIRYTRSDLEAWAEDDTSGVQRFRSNAAEFETSNALFLVGTSIAASYLTLTRFCLTNYRSEREGPRFYRFGRRIHYSTMELVRWAMTRRINPAAHGQSTLFPLTGITP